MSFGGSGKKTTNITSNSRGYRRCWIPLSAEEVFYDLKQNQLLFKGGKPDTFDFTSMHTCLDHNKIF